jgi:hypothetical protein
MGMKSIIAILILFASWPAYAGTDQKTIDFLEKLNRYYFCLSREGLKNFSADIAFSLTPECEQAMPESKTKIPFITTSNKLRFRVFCSSDSTPTVTLVPPVPSGSARLDSAVMKTGEMFRAMIEGAIQTWTEQVFKPLHDQQTYDRGCVVQKTATGFSVIDTDKKGNLIESQGKSLGYSGTINGTAVSSKSDYMKTDKGLLATGYAADIQGMNMAVTFEYGTVGGFWLLKSLLSKMTGPQLPGNNLSFVLTFSNYKLNQ